MQNLDSLKSIKTQIPARHRRFNSTVLERRRHKTVVAQGETFSIHLSSSIRTSIIWVDPGLTQLFWGKEEMVRLPSGRFNASKAENSILLNSVERIITDCREYGGKTKSFIETFHANEECCMCIETADQTLDLEASSPYIRDAWAAALGNIVFADRLHYMFGEEEDDDFLPACLDNPIIEQDDSNHVAGATTEIKTVIAPYDGTAGLTETISDNQFTNAATTSNVDLYSKGRRLSGDLQSSIQTHGANRSGHRRTHSFITKSLMTSDSRFSQLAAFIRKCREELQADRGSLYLVDRPSKSATSLVIEGEQGDLETYNFYEGFVGCVAASGHPVIIKDAYEDIRFNQERDVLASYKTTCVIAGPVIDRAGQVIAVLKFTNRQDHQYQTGWFSEEKHLHVLKAQCSGMRDILETINDYEFFRTISRVTAAKSDIDGNSEDHPIASNTTNAHRRTNSVATRQLEAENSLFRVLAPLVRQARQAVNADRAQLYAVDNRKLTYESIVLEGCQELSVSGNFSSGIIGAVASSGLVEIVDDAYADDRFNRAIDERSAYKTTSLLVHPVKTKSGQVVGVAAFLNKQDFPFKKGYFLRDHCERITPTLRSIADCIEREVDTTVLVSIVED